MMDKPSRIMFSFFAGIVAAVLVAVLTPLLALLAGELLWINANGLFYFVIAGALLGTMVGAPASYIITVDVIRRWLERSVKEPQKPSGFPVTQRDTDQDNAKTGPGKGDT